MKILEISSLQENTPPHGYGGVERFVHYLSSQLSKTGDDVTVVLKDGSEGGEYRKLEVNSENIINKVDKFLKNNAVDIVHINYKQIDLIEYFKKTSIQVVLTLHNNIRQESGWLSIIKYAPKNFNFSVISNSLKNRLIEKMELSGYKINGREIEVIDYASPHIATVNTKKIKDYYLYLGVIARYKGVLDIVKYFSTTNNNLLVVGPCNNDDEQKYFNQMLEIINKSQNIKYYGATKDEQEKISLVSGAKAIIMATGYDPLEFDCHEAFGLVMLEANQMGVPVIGYAKGNVKDYIIDGVNGYKFNKLEEINNIIFSIESNDLSEKCIEYSNRFDIEVVSKKYRQYFDKILSRKSLT